MTEILREAEETDRQEHELYGDRRGDEPPEPLPSRRVAAKRFERKSVMPGKCMVGTFGPHTDNGVSRTHGPAPS